MTDSSIDKYAAASVLASEVAERMLLRLEWVNLQPGVILDAGCGVGQSAALLTKRYPLAQILAMDSALSMLQYAKKKESPSIKWIGAQSEELPLPDHSVDLIFANLLLPWCADLQKIGYEWRRVLRPEGLLMFTTLGPDTLKEWPGTAAINRVDMHDIGDILTHIGWVDPVLDVEYIQMVYREKERLMDELKVTDMIAQDSPDVQLEKNENGVFPITYEIVYGHAWNSNLSIGYAPDEAGVAKIPLSHLRRKKQS
jgi:malonyl-CoA O-methyltransferase